ncbi:hypothetical protein D3C78_1540100 [compost metagenome]
MDVLTNCRQLRHTHQDVQHPAVPARQEAGETTPVFVGKMAERTGHRLFDDHFAQLAHDHEGDEATDRIAENHRRTGRFHHASRAQEQPGTNCTAQGDQLNVAIFQAAFQLA